MKLDTLLKWLLATWMTVVFALAIFWVPPSEFFANRYGNGNIAKIIFVHVPLAMICLVGFLAAAISGGLYLRRRDPIADIKAAAWAEVGLIYCILATLTGMVFAWYAWGHPWPWDPKQIGIAVVLMTYAAYFFLRSALDDDTRSTISSVYLLFAFFMSIFSVYAIPRLMTVQGGTELITHHPEGLVFSGGLTDPYSLVFWLSILGFLALYAWLVRLRVSIAMIQWKRRRPPPRGKMGDVGDT